MKHPVYLVAGEVEFSIHPPDSEAIGRMADAGYEKVSCSPSALASERQLITAAREDATAMLATLVPESDEEADRLTLWKSQVPEFTIGDAVNYRVYEELSVPALSYKQSTVDMTRSQIEAVSPGEVEFRFGPGVFQEGYYDNRTISEIRLSPRSDKLYPARRKLLRDLVGTVAAQHGLAAYVGTEHINMSPYNDELSYLPDPRQDIEPYVAVAAGLRRVLHEGILYDITSDPPMPVNLGVSPWRGMTDVRMMPGRFEFRGFCYQTEDPEFLWGTHPLKALRFMRAGMEYGLLHATDDDKRYIERLTTLATQPDTDYDRVEDLSVQRLVGAMCLDKDGSITVAPIAMDATMARALERITDIQGLPYRDKEFADFIATMRLRGSHVQIEDERMWAFRKALRGSRLWLEINKQKVNDRLRRIAVEPVSAIAWRGDVQGADEVLANVAKATALQRVAPEQYASLSMAAAQKMGKLVSVS